MDSKKRGWWHYSKIRFFILNSMWNYRFWLNAKKVYSEYEYKVVNDNGFHTGEKRKGRKFIGYEYKGKMYLDNPGMPMDRDQWEKWKEKGLIK